MIFAIPPTFRGEIDASYWLIALEHKVLLLICGFFNRISQSVVISRVLHGVLALAIMCSCSRDQKSWTVVMPQHGTNSSPRLIDLTQDGVLDVVLGVCKNELHRTDTGVIALDGKDGDVLWSVPARDQIFGSALFLKIDSDYVPDLIIGGRQAELMAISGSNGNIIWEFFPQGDSIFSGSVKLFNFYNPQLIPDQDGDGLEDVVISNGGNFLAGIGDESNRYPGILMIISSATGEVLAQDSVPDGKETYMSVVLDHSVKGIDVIFGSGGETIGGHLYKASLMDLIGADLSNSKTLMGHPGKGFIAPPILVDLNQDGEKDIVGNAYGGIMYSIDGQSDSILWSVELDRAEVNATPAIGNFNGDVVPDFFGVYGIGLWPDLKRTKQILVDGKSGKIIWSDSVGCFQSSSPVVADLDQDGFDEVILSVNDYNCYATDLSTIENKLMVFDFNQDTTYQLGPGHKAKNIGSTPWLGDLEGDGTLDIVYTNMAGTVHMDEFKGLQIHRLATNLQIKKPLRWSEYMGSGGDGVY